MLGEDGNGNFFDVVLQEPLFLAPLARHLVEEIVADLAVKLVDVHRVNAFAKLTKR